LTISQRILCAAVVGLVAQNLAHASSLLVSYSSTNGGGIEKFSLTPQSTGTLFASDNAAINTLTTANNTAYWATSTQISSDSLNDATGGSGKTALPSIPFGGVTITDLAVDPATNDYYVGWNAPGFGWFIAQYPPSGSNFAVFANATTLVQGLTIANNTAYWIEGQNIYSQDLGTTTRHLLQSFTLGPVTLNDVAIDTAGQTYLLAASENGLPPLIARYPLTPNASGVLFTFGTNPITALTVAGDRAYWIDGSNVWSENLNGTDLTLQETLPASFTLTDLAVSIDPPAAAPEPSGLVMLAGGLICIIFRGRHHSNPR